MGTLSGLMNGHEPSWIDASASLKGLLSDNHFLGTDDLGRDLWARLAQGGLISLWVGVATALASVVLGGILGIVAARCGGWVDTWVMRGVDVLSSLPSLMLVVLFSVLLGKSLWALVISITLLSWPDATRVIRAATRQQLIEPYMEAYTALGGGTTRWLTHYWVRNVAGVLILAITLTVPRAILAESTLSFLGLGVAPPLSSWGTLASDGWQLVRVAPSLLILPTTCIYITLLGFNSIGDWLEARLKH
jgi:oligopeptide transport system permease protein